MDGDGVAKDHRARCTLEMLLSTVDAEYMADDNDCDDYVAPSIPSKDGGSSSATCLCYDSVRDMRLLRQILPRREERDKRPLGGVTVDNPSSPLLENSYFPEKRTTLPENIQLLSISYSILYHVAVDYDWLARAVYRRYETIGLPDDYPSLKADAREERQRMEAILTPSRGANGNVEESSGSKARMYWPH